MATAPSASSADPAAEVRSRELLWSAYFRAAAFAAEAARASGLLGAAAGTFGSTVPSILLLLRYLIFTYLCCSSH